MDQQFAQLVDALVQRFAGVHERDTVARVVSETRARLEAGARVTTYLPILAADRRSICWPGARHLRAHTRPEPLPHPISGSRAVSHHSTRSALDGRQSQRPPSITCGRGHRDVRQGDVRRVRATMERVEITTSVRGDRACRCVSRPGSSSGSTRNVPSSGTGRTSAGPVVPTPSPIRAAEPVPDLRRGTPQRPADPLRTGDLDIGHVRHLRAGAPGPPLRCRRTSGGSAGPGATAVLPGARPARPHAAPPVRDAYLLAQGPRRLRSPDQHRGRSASGLGAGGRPVRSRRPVRRAAADRGDHRPARRARRRQCGVRPLRRGVRQRAGGPQSLRHVVLAGRGAGPSCSGSSAGLSSCAAASPGDDVISRLATAPGEQIPADDIVPLCTLLLIAGFETTVNLIGNTVHALLRPPRLWRGWSTTRPWSMRPWRRPFAWTHRCSGPPGRRGRHRARWPAGLPRADGGGPDRWSWSDPETVDRPDEFDLDRAGRTTSPSRRVRTTAWVVRWPSWRRPSPFVSWWPASRSADRRSARAAARHPDSRLGPAARPHLDGPPAYVPVRLNALPVAG